MLTMLLIIVVGWRRVFLFRFFRIHHIPYRSRTRVRCERFHMHNESSFHSSANARARPFACAVHNIHSKHYQATHTHTDIRAVSNEMK